MNGNKVDEGWMKKLANDYGLKFLMAFTLFETVECLSSKFYLKLV